MKNLLSKRQIDKQMPYAYLHLVWYVDEDNTYHQFKTPGIHLSDYIAVRTISGSGTLIEFSGRKHVLNAGTIAFIRSDDVAEYYANEEGWHLYWFRFDHESWQGPVNQVSVLPILDWEQNKMEQCFAYLNSQVPEECWLAESLFNFLLSDWLMRMKMSARKELSRQRIVALLEKGWREGISMNDLAVEAGMSERSFRDVVHRICGMPPKEFIVKLKMEAAMELLQTTSKSVTEVANDLDFENPFYFSRVFKKYYGIAPKQARYDAQKETLQADQRSGV